jgi:SAM-dependent methyltransferase
MGADSIQSDGDQVRRIHRFAFRLRPVRSLPMRGLWRVSTAMTRLGERLGVDWLIYNPLAMHSYHRLALADAEPMIRTLKQTFPDARRYIDVGAGTGTFAAAAQRNGRQVLACERSLVGRLYARRQGVSARPLDLTRDPPMREAGRFDLAYCFEVAEHLDAPLGDRLVEFLAASAPFVVFTAAPPGQGGFGHVNEQPRGYWIKRFEAEGMTYLAEVTTRVAAEYERRGGRGMWLRDNVMVFERRLEDDPGE